MSVDEKLQRQDTGGSGKWRVASGEEGVRAQQAALKSALIKLQV
jgi:hypothetical protein